jgi:hypothetical protein
LSIATRQNTKDNEDDKAGRPEQYRENPGAMCSQNGSQRRVLAVRAILHSFGWLGTDHFIRAFCAEFALP